ncbi:MAG TPA: aldehyde dehydrogenase family protein, partial [Longilinea sp.]|nr:aldehyde dehydrogenase family protein [Longilinea sp.]
DLRQYYLDGNTRSLTWRYDQLKALKRLLAEHYSDFEAALYRDLHKSPFECYATEMGFLTTDIDYALEHLSQWVESPTTETPVCLQAATSRVMFEPLGLVLIMGAWNYPLQLTLGPLVGAIAAGNAAVVKPPRTAAETFKALAKYFPQYMDQKAFMVISDDTPNDLLLDLPWDKIFLTGSGQIGKIVMKAAAKYLTPVTLELGGKSPTVVEKTADIDVAARRIVQGKFINAGQTCVAPDYLLVQEPVLDDLIAGLIKYIHEFFGDDPYQSAEYGRIVNLKQFDILTEYLKDGEVVIGGQVERNELYIAPTILKNVSPESPVMQAEIFGPILPILTVKDMDEAIDFVNGRDKPLALYVFSEDRAIVQKVLEHTTSGGACVNDTVNHLAIPSLPFGGVGPSGVGKYHGEWGFREFSNARAVYDHDTHFDPGVRYPPFDEKKLNSLKQLMGMQIPAVFNGGLGRVLKYFGNMIMR